MNEPKTAERILDVAQSLCQRKGFHGFSFRDIAKVLGIKSASIHYHFATKDSLGESLMTRYRGDFGATLARIKASESDPKRRLQLFSESLARVLEDGGKVCLCGILASEYDSLSPTLKKAVSQFFADAEAWVEECLEQGRESGEFTFKGSSRTAAQSLVSSLQGLMMCSRALEDHKRFAMGSAWLQSVL